MAARLTTALGQQRKSQSASLITVSTVVLAGSVAQTHQISDSMIHLDRDPFAAPLWGDHVFDLVQSRKSLLSKPNIAAPQLLP